MLKRYLKKEHLLRNKFFLNSTMMEQNDEDFNYDTQYKKLCTGLGSFLNSAQQNQSFSSGAMTNDGSSSSSSTAYSSAELSKCKMLLFSFTGI